MPWTLPRDQCKADALLKILRFRTFREVGEAKSEYLQSAWGRCSTAEAIIAYLYLPAWWWSLVLEAASVAGSRILYPRPSHGWHCCCCYSRTIAILTSHSIKKAIPFKMSLLSRRRPSNCQIHLVHQLRNVWPLLYKLAHLSPRSGNSDRLRLNFKLLGGGWKVEK